jgi:hypothetical protein
MARHKFIAFDGEGYNINENHEYVMLNSSENRNVENFAGLTTLECFDFILSHCGLGTGISFAFSYDVNMILKGVHPLVVSKLAKDDWTVCNFKSRPGLYYRIEYIPKKIFTIYECKRVNEKEKVIRSFKIYDVFGFFQKSFVNALKDFGIGSAYIAELEEMKNTRSDFESTNFDSIREYCYTECRLLVDLMNYVNDKFKSVGIELAHFHGSGAVASKVLQNHKIKNHINRYNGELNTAINTAYFGGRIQCLEVGTNYGVHSYDVVSAYPSAMLDLPSIASVKPVKKLRFETGFSLWFVSWDIDAEISPFPVRDKNGRIWYPKRGSGWYWSPEVETALRIYGNAINVKYGYVWKTDNQKPFSFIQDLFELRKRLKEQKDDAQKCVKLALNSLYGKTAQGENNRGIIPPFQCYAYAGYITSKTRSNLLNLASQDFDAVISFATDGIVSKRPLDANIGENLGDWEYTKYDSIFIIKPGFYQLELNGKTTDRVRGFNPKNVNFDLLKSVYAEYGIVGTVPITETRFIGMKNRCAEYKWRNWYSIKKDLNFRPTGFNFEPIGDNYRIESPDFVVPVSLEYQKNRTAEQIEIDFNDFRI